MQCPKCGAVSGDDWSQCNGSCPIPGSPHHKQLARLSPAQRRLRARAMRKMAQLADKAVDKRGPGTNHGQGWGDTQSEREMIHAPGAYRIPAKPGAE